MLYNVRDKYLNLKIYETKSKYSKLDGCKMKFRKINKEA